MKRYIALLRGINISGRNRIEMPLLKQEFIALGHENVRTHLNSGNIIFDCPDNDPGAIADAIHMMIEEKFGLGIPVLVIGQDELKRILEAAPDWWGNDDRKIYDNLIFVFPQYSLQEVCDRIGKPSEGLERIQLHERVIFWSFDLAKHAKANWWKKTAMNGIGEMMTIRTANTSRKIAEM